MYAVVGIPAQIVARRNMLLSSAFLLRNVSIVPETTPSNSRNCPQWTTEKQIQVVKARENLSYFESKQRCSISKQTYASALKTTVSQGTQTDISSKNSELPTHEFSKPSFRSVASGSTSKSRPPASHSKPSSSPLSLPPDTCPIPTSNKFSSLSGRKSLLRQSKGIEKNKKLKIPRTSLILF
ncbi:hypothetical protein CEXT_467601 [Caerostris extrusa]|uniref:Uncharacterized protein n=1 Tax=Caerostris extrusa TaxID=172846 RepID=A0AAV4WX45_CAEEX|nr:hypothetical protein CEXT_467601 [Caerostris extrusa]